jgi:hypothetical protein
MACRVQRCAEPLCQRAIIEGNSNGRFVIVKHYETLSPAWIVSHRVDTQCCIVVLHRSICLTSYANCTRLGAAKNEDNYMREQVLAHCKGCGGTTTTVSARIQIHEHARPPQKYINCPKCALLLFLCQHCNTFTTTTMLVEKHAVMCDTCNTPIFEPKE